MNLDRMLTHTARLFPERPGVIEDGGRTWCWREIEERVDAMAAALRALGVVRGDRIPVQSRNTVQMFESCWVAFRLGRVWVPTNFRLTPSEAAELGASSGATVMVAEDVFAGHVNAVRAASPTLRHVIPAGGARGRHDCETPVARHHSQPLPHETVA